MTAIYASSNTFYNSTSLQFTARCAWLGPIVPLPTKKINVIVRASHFRRSGKRSELQEISSDLSLFPFDGSRWFGSATERPSMR